LDIARGVRFIGEMESSNEDTIHQIIARLENQGNLPRDLSLPSLEALHKSVNQIRLSEDKEVKDRAMLSDPPKTRFR
jgi:hypothetical protein